MTPKVLVCFGDSNTHGSMPMRHCEDVRRQPPDKRWPGILAADLGPAWRVYEEGLPGRTTVHRDPVEGDHLCGLAAVPMVIGSHTPIDTVVLALGVNDFKTRFSVTAADIASSVEVLVNAIRSWSKGPGRAEPQILVVAPPPILETGCLARFFAGGRAKSLALGALLGESTQRVGTSFVDAGAYVRSSDVDGIHWDADQHRKLAAAIVAELGGANLSTRSGLLRS